MRIVKLLLFLLAFYRLFVAVAIEAPLLAGWPVSNLATECKAKCPIAWESALCFKHCELRQKIKLDLADYEKADPVFTSMVSTFQQKVAMGILIASSVFIFFTSVGNLFGSGYAKKWGLFYAGVLFQLFVPYCVEVVRVSSSPQTFFLYNIGDILLVFFLLLNGLISDARRTEVKAAEAAPTPVRGPEQKRRKSEKQQ